MKLIEKLIAAFLLIMGISIISVWIMLIVSDQVPDIKKDIFSFIFHWISELMLAILSIVLFYVLIRKSKRAIPALFFNLGLAVCSTTHAISYYYLKEFNIAMILFIGLFFILSLLSFIYYFISAGKIQNTSYIYKVNFGLFSIGITIYLLLNIAGQYGEKGEWIVFINLMLIIIIGIYYAMFFIKKLFPY